MTPEKSRDTSKMAVAIHKIERYPIYHIVVSPKAPGAMSYGVRVEIPTELFMELERVTAQYKALQDQLGNLYDQEERKR